MLFSLLLVLGVSLPGKAGCQEMSNAEILREIQELKARIEHLERLLEQKGDEVGKAERTSPQARQADDHVSGHVLGKTPMELSKEESGPSLRWDDRITLSGLVELEVGSERRRARGSSEDGRATKDRVDEGPFLSVELAADVRVNESLSGRIVLSYEEEEESEVVLDEGTVRLGEFEKLGGL